MIAKSVNGELTKTVFATFNPKAYDFYFGTFSFGGPGSSVGIATGYGLDGPGIESRWGRNFSHLSGPVLESTQPPVQWVPALSRG